MAEGLTESAARDRLRVVSDEILERVTRALPAWVVAEVGRIAGAWAAASEATMDWEPPARRAAAAASDRVSGDLRALFASEPEQMTRTPLEVVRTAVTEPTEVLSALGIPPVDRDEFAARSWPDDRYGLTPGTLAELGDADLGPLLLAWGMAKAAALRVVDDR